MLDARSIGENRRALIHPRPQRILCQHLGVEDDQVEGAGAAV